MTKQEALELLKKSLKDMTAEERKRAAEALRIVSAWGPVS
jgi:hypothetical protein